MKRAWRIYLALLALAAPAAAQAQFGYQTNGDSTVTITNFIGSGAVTIPTTNGDGLAVGVIGLQAFYNDTTITSVTIPGSVSNIEDSAFAGCTGLTNITIPASITNIGVGVFNGCASLTNITVDPLSTNYSSTNGVLFDTNQATLIEYPDGLLGAYTVPDGVLTIGQDAFFGCSNLAGITFPAGLLNVGQEAFFGCGALTAIPLPQSVTNISQAAFEFCTNLADFVIPSNVTSIEAVTFEFCTHLTNVFIPVGVTSIGDSAFDFCTSLTNITIPDTVTNIAVDAFNGCTSLASVVIPPSVSSLGNGVFESCTNLTNVVIPVGVTTIAGSAFNGCTGLSNIVIPSTVTNIGSDAFEGCSNLTSVSFTGNAPTAASNVFASDPNVMLFYLPGTTGWNSNFAGLAPTVTPTGSLQVTLTPSTVVDAGAQWRINGGPLQNSGATVTNLVVSNYTVSFSAVGGWTTPSNQTVAISNGLTTTALGFYVPTAAPSDGLILLTNGFGAIQHGNWPASLVTGKKYTVTAVAQAKNVFANWVGGTSQPYSNLSATASYTFTMQPNLLLEANFTSNYFLVSHGTYRGLFAPTNAPQQQTNSGSFMFTVSTGRGISGSLVLGGQSVPLSGKFDPYGAASIISKRPKGETSLTTTLQLDFANASVSGTVTNVAFAAQLGGDLDVFTGTNKATNFEGQYTFVIPGGTNPAVGPYGTSYGTVKISPQGAVTLAGSLADGTAISQSSEVSKDGFRPMYVKLYNGNGSLWGWTFFTTNHLLTNAAPPAFTNVPSLSWINGGNTARTALYLSGFTNQQATLSGGLYLSADALPAGLTVTLQETNPAYDIIVSNLLGNTNKLTLRTNKTTGLISGTFGNPAAMTQLIKVNGVILQGTTNAQGYFLGPNQSGTLNIGPP